MYVVNTPLFSGSYGGDSGRSSSNNENNGGSRRRRSVCCWKDANSLSLGEPLRCRTPSLLTDLVLLASDANQPCRKKAQAYYLLQWSPPSKPLWICANIKAVAGWQVCCFCASWNSASSLARQGLSHHVRDWNLAAQSLFWPINQQQTDGNKLARDRAGVFVVVELAQIGNS